MGKPTSQQEFNQSSGVSANIDQSSGVSANIDQSSNSINHFSHPHTLQLISYQSQQLISSCSGCKQEASGMIYTCTMCNYFLHPKCSQMPQRITHPFDQLGHVLSLLTKPAYPEGLFNCDACGEQGNGFSYHCQDCGTDLHILCASLPMVLRHSCHPDPLNLTFSPPYPTNNFSCDICKRIGSKNWLYRCNTCEFDVHLSCVNMLPRSNIMSTNPPFQHHNQPSLVQQFQSMMPKTLAPQQITQRSTPIMPTNFAPTAVNPNPTYNTFGPSCGFVHPQTQPQVFATTFAAPPRPMSNPMQNFMHSQPNNFMSMAGANNGTFVRPAATQGNGLMGQMVNGIASGAAQALAGALVQDLMGGGNNNGGNDGGFGVIDTSGSAMADGGYGGGGGDPNAAATY